MQVVFLLFFFLNIFSLIVWIQTRNMGGRSSDAVHTEAVGGSVLTLSLTVLSPLASLFDTM